MFKKMYKSTWTLQAYCVIVLVNSEKISATYINNYYYCFIKATDSFSMVYRHNNLTWDVGRAQEKHASFPLVVTTYHLSLLCQ